MNIKINGFTTKAIHGLFENNDCHKSLRTPIYDSVSFEFDDAQSISDAFTGKKPAHSYSRVTNPTVADFEQKINLLTEGLGTIALSSGMAAISNTILAIAQNGDNIITTKFLFGNTYSLFNETLKQWGLNVKYADFENINDIEKSINANTRAVFLETISNPQLAVYDIESIAEITKKHGILLIIDSTLTPPYLFKAKDFGVNIEIISSTKYISGGATSVGGLIIDYGNYDWQNIPKLKELNNKHGNNTFLIKLRKEVYRNLGACLSPHSAYLQTLGLETMALRIDKSCENAVKLCEFLKNNPKIKHINYPGLKENKYHENAVKLFKNKFGGLLTFDLSGKDECFKFIDNLKIIRRATNFNDNKTLIIHPSSTIFSEFTEEQKNNLGVSDATLRLSAGIEDIDDIIEDISQSLSMIK